MNKGDLVWPSDFSEEDAREQKAPRIFIANVGGVTPFICVRDGYEDDYPDGAYYTCRWKYAVPVEESEQITNRDELMMQIQERLRDGEIFLVREDDESLWRLPSYWGYDVGRSENYEWTAVDEHGHATGEPQKFVKGYKYQEVNK